MKKLLIFSILVFMSLVSKAQNSETHEYTGTIAGKYPITMVLVITSNCNNDYCVITYGGYYYYNNVGKRIKIEGGYNPMGMDGANPDANDIFSESSDGKYTGQFTFKRNVIGSQNMNGYWEGSQGKKMTVSLRKVY